MKKTLHNFILGVATVSTLTILTVANAADNRTEMNSPGDLNLDITEDISESNVLPNADLDLSLPELPLEAAPQAVPQAAPAPAPQTAPAPVPVEVPALEAPVSLAQVPATNIATPGNSEANSNILDEPITAATISQQPKADVPVTEETSEQLPTLPPAENSILKNSPEEDSNTVPQENEQPQENVETIDPSEIPAAGTTPVIVNGGMARPLRPGMNGGMARPLRPGMGGGSCPDCPEMMGTRRPISYGIQRNGIHAYPRAGHCPECERMYMEPMGPMVYPYYTLRGPRDFDDPNPRPIGP